MIPVKQQISLIPFSIEKEITVSNNGSISSDVE